MVTSLFAIEGVYEGSWRKVRYCLANPSAPVELKELKASA